MKVLFHTKRSQTLVQLQSLAMCLGVNSECINVGIVGSLLLAVREAILAKTRGIVLDVGSLKDKCDEAELRELAACLLRHKIVVLLLVSDVDQSATRFLSILTNNAILGIEPIEQASRVNFPASSRALSKELSSYSYPRKSAKGISLILSSARKAQVVMTLDVSPTFVCAGVGEANVFVWATDVVFNVSKLLTAEIEFEQATEQYIPAIIFLRFAFGERCWHNPRPGAGFIIDDPLLRRSYGFIKFPQLLASAKKHQYHITLAFIPWNHWRTRTRDAQMFLKYSDCFSPCAHGCDHTNQEFRSTDYERLLRMIFAARQRMERHQTRTGLTSEPLMVCPQEQYSLEALRAFADSRQFLGLICTACIPRNLSTPQIHGADLLLPAQDSFYGFPVFKRHYWNGMAAFAMALFFGKPAILVEHHEFLRNGSVAPEEFAQKLAELRPDLQWKSLAETVTATHTRRRVSGDKWEVRFFTDTFQLEFELKQPIDLKLFRRMAETTRIERVRVDGREVPFSREDGFLMLETHLDYPQTLSVKVDCRSVKPTKFYSPGVRYQASVALRRGLSELRDNVIARNPVILRASKRLMKSFKQAAS